MKKIRLGIMGFGHIGRQLYHLASSSEEFEISAVVDIGDPEILRYLLATEAPEGSEYLLEGNYLHNGKFSTRMLSSDQPSEVPWDVFAVDLVIDATGRFGRREDMQSHLDNGARRVLLSTLPMDHIDRVILRGINDDSISEEDRMISGGSATTEALGLALQAFSEQVDIASASMTSVHAYTSDQSLQDYAGPDYRRSRSAPENIIPNTTLAPFWVQRILPGFRDKLDGFALNVPVQRGSLLDLNLVLEDENFSAADATQLMLGASQALPDLIGAASDPIVSSDVLGCSQSLLFDLKATTKAGKRTLKVLGWYESLGHASRLLEVARTYASLKQPPDARPTTTTLGGDQP